MDIEVALYESLRAIQAFDFPVGKSASGKKFEDHMVIQLCQRLQQHEGFRVFPPRYTLREATFSGVHHQFDIVVTEQEQLAAVECKFRGSVHIDQLFATQGKLVDYCKRPRGVFVTTAPSVNDEMYYYALAHQIVLICPSLPPVEYMLQCVRKGTDLAHRLETLQNRLKDGAPPNHMLVEWKNNYMRFQNEGYC
jgi:hypothetical protein